MPEEILHSWLIPQLNTIYENVGTKCRVHTCQRLFKRTLLKAKFIIAGGGQKQSTSSCKTRKWDALKDKHTSSWPCKWQPRLTQLLKSSMSHTLRAAFAQPAPRSKLGSVFCSPFQLTLSAHHATPSAAGFSMEKLSFAYSSFLSHQQWHGHAKKWVIHRFLREVLNTFLYLTFSTAIQYSYCYHGPGQTCLLSRARGKDRNIHKVHTAGSWLSEEIWRRDGYLQTMQKLLWQLQIASLLW